MTMLMTLSIMSSITFTQMKHPMAMGLLLLIQTILMSTISGMMSKNFWFSYILFLIFLGGMLILFIYMTSLTSNEMFYLSTKMIMILMITLPITALMIKNSWLEIMLNNQESINFLLLNNMPNMLIKLYNQPNNIIIIMLGSYLFLTLITVIKITNIFKGPLRKFY